MGPNDATTVANVLINGVAMELPLTCKVLNAIPEDQLDFRLGDKGRTAREIAWHLYDSECWFGRSIARKAFAMDFEPVPEGITAQEIAQRLASEVPALLDAIRGMSGEDLGAPVDLFGMMTIPNFGYLQFWSNHSIHHRAQLATYLRALNLRVPSIYGGSADEAMGAAAEA